MQTTLNSCCAIYCAEPTAADIAQLEELQRQMDILRENGHTPDHVSSTVDGNTAASTIPIAENSVMNMQCLGEVAMVCLFAMKLHEESWDAESSRYGLSMREASEDAVAASMDGRPPETQKAVSGLIHLMITSWNDAEFWATAIVAYTANNEGGGDEH